jgi:transposase
VKSYGPSKPGEIERNLDPFVKNSKKLAKLGKSSPTFDAVRVCPRLKHSSPDRRIAALCRREGIAESLYYKWSKDFLESGKQRLAGDTARAANTDEAKDLRHEARNLKEVVAEQTCECRPRRCGNL